MSQSISTVVTDIWRQKLARIHAGDDLLGEFSLPSEFQIGEGGFAVSGNDKHPKNPDPGREELEAPTLSAENSYVFSKALILDDLIFSSPNRLEVRCLVGSSEANEDNVGDPPEFFELGVFDAQGVMIAYSTFPMEIKTSSKTLEHTIFVDF